jgi:hypothetical protein
MSNTVNEEKIAAAVRGLSCVPVHHPYVVNMVNTGRRKLLALIAQAMSTRRHSLSISSFRFEAIRSCILLSQANSLKILRVQSRPQGLRKGSEEGN